MVRSGIILALVVALSATTMTARADEALARKAYAFLRKYCKDCHGGSNDQNYDIHVLERETLIKPSETEEKDTYVVPGNPGKSLVWQKMGVSPYQMPKGKKPRPSDDERKIIEQWILAGAEFPKAVDRKPVDDRTELTAIRDHLKRLRPTDRPFQRYLSLNHLHNNKSLDESVLRIHRAAASKLINSLSWQPDIVVPSQIEGTEGTILNFDLRKLGWSVDDWRLIARAYPYGVIHAEDEAFRELEDEVRTLTKFRLSVLRADWFVVTVSRPPIYDQLMRLPTNLRDLERKLNVHLEQNFDQDILRRGGLVSSGVSRHNRLVERHPTPFGAYWRSYDFASSAGDGNLLLNPLGPKFPGNKYLDQAFVQAGGEVIFNLPNGLQGYMLAKADDTRLDGPAPIAIVRDEAESSGTPEVVNGISCIFCHKDGMRSFEDDIAKHPAVFADARIKMQRLYASADEMDKLLEKDEARFLGAQEQAIGLFLKDGEDGKKNKRGHIIPDNELLGDVVKLYNQDLTPDSIANELDLPDITKLQIKLGENKFQELGLGPLLDAKAVKRELWEGANGSLFHQVANELGLARNQFVQ
jgi:serine/threonine-protein kinase